MPTPFADLTEPTLPAPLLYQLYHSLMGTQAPQWSEMDYAMGLGAGPSIKVSGALQKALGGGFGKLRRGALARKSAKALEGRNPTGRPDVPSWDVSASTESPGGRK